jgi:hypothetical protein
VKTAIFEALLVYCIAFVGSAAIALLLKGLYHTLRRLAGKA